MTGITNKLQSLFRFRKTVDPTPGFGTFIGVFVPSILMVFGVIIFLRLGWIVGQVGLSTTLIIVTFASLITLVTALSMASISTNIEVGKGGVYYILSRSLGLEVGAAVGLPLYLKQSLSIAFCVIGFAESLHLLLPSFSITSLGIATLAGLTGLAYFSLNGALKVQLGIFIALIASFISLFWGNSDPATASLSAQTFEVSRPLGFWAIFAIFFPAMTGVESSVSLSGDLKNPARSLPLGTISALLAAYAIYMIIPIFLAQKVSMDVLASNPFIMQAIAKIPALIIVGIWGATISSALGGLLGAPRTLQALADDGVVPKIFGKTFGASKDPKVATVTTFVIALCGIYFGSVNIIAPLLTMICLICYGVLNLSAGLETLMANPSWRPRFRIHWSVSLLGAVLCLLTMLMIDAGTAIIALSIVLAIYLIAERRQIKGSWDDMRHGILVYFSRLVIYRLSYGEAISKSWRPHFLVFSKATEAYSNNTLRFSQAISQSKGFLTMASFTSLPFNSEQEKREIKKDIAQRLQQENIHALVKIVHAEKVTFGMNHMIKNYGLGPLVPNTIVFGGMPEDEGEEFATVIHDSHQRHCNVVILNENKSKDSKRENLNAPSQDIHIWWDDDQKENSDLMLVLTYMLQRNLIWKKSRVCLKAIVKDELSKEEELKKFQALSISKRIPLNIEILISDDPSNVFTEFVEKHSKNAGIIFLSLRSPKIDESMADYCSYLKSMTRFSEHLPPAALVLSSEHTPLDNILQ